MLTRTTRAPTQLLALQRVLPHAPGPVPAAFAVASRHLPSHLHRARRLGTACVATCAAHTRPLADARLRVPHTHRADRTIKKKPRGRRNPPANEAVTKWLIIETLERATPEEIVQFAFCVCDA